MTEGKKEIDFFFDKYDFIKEIEQLKADKSELVELLNTIIYKRDGNYYIGLEGDSMIQLSENLIKIWEHGK